MKKITVNDLYNIMYDHMDPSGWWPGRDDWEIIWGAILIQNTSWRNVDKALPNLYAGTHFLPKAIRQTSLLDIQEMIRSSGFFTRKAQTIKNVAEFFANYHDDAEGIRIQSRQEVRQELLSIPGIGHETADVILMYVAQKPNFIVDAYARKLFANLGVVLPKQYDAAQQLVESQLSDFTLRTAQNFHAMIDDFNIQNRQDKAFKKSFLAAYQLKL